jgi:hypothetical protein
MILPFNHARKNILDQYFFYLDWFSLFRLIKCFGVKKMSFFEIPKSFWGS